MESVPTPTAAQGPVNGGALIAVMTGTASLIFAMAQNSEFYRFAFPLSIVAILSGAWVLRGGYNGGKLALSGLVLGTISFCMVLVDKNRALALLGTALLVKGAQTYRKTIR